MSLLHTVVHLSRGQTSSDVHANLKEKMTLEGLMEQTVLQSQGNSKAWANVQALSQRGKVL